MSGLRKDMELHQKSMEFLTASVMNISHKVENIELQVETATMGVLKEFFGFGDGSASPVEGLVSAAIHRLDPGAGENEEPGMPLEEALGEVDHGSCGCQLSLPFLNICFVE